MEKRQLGNSDLNVSVIGFGAWAAGKAGWGNVTERDLEEAIILAYELGINLFDTAPVYGFGESERVLGRVLKSIRENVIIATKFGLLWDAQGIHNDVTAANVYREVDLSLQRLGTDYIDLYQIHWPDPTGATPIEETIAALADLVKAGKIRHIGVSNFSVEQLAEAQTIAPIVSLQSPYNLLQRKVEQAELPYVSASNVGFIAYSPLAQGLLTGKFTLETSLHEDDVRKQLNPLFNEGEYEQALQKVEQLKQLANQYGKTPAQVALNWLLSETAVTTVIAGAKSAVQVKENTGGTGWKLDVADVERLRTSFAEIF